MLAADPKRYEALLDLVADLVVAELEAERLNPETKTPSAAAIADGAETSRDGRDADRSTS
jgi:hypothetical protein